jgi:hypothetical protein
MIPLSPYEDNSAQSSFSTNYINTNTSSSHTHFWEREKVYINEHRIGSVVPTMRFLNTIFIMYALYLGIDFIVGLCTFGMEFICSIALIFTISYWLWATW